MVQNIVFDFDGTLADSLELALAFGRENQHRFSKKVLTRDEFRSRTMREVMQYVEVPLWRVPQFVMELKTHLKKHADRVELFPGVAELITDLRARKLDLYILSSNAEENIRAVLSRTPIKDDFNDIITDSSLFGKDKVLARLFKRLGLSIDKTLYVGDEVRDLEACKKLGLNFLAVSWGWDSEELLRRFGCEHMVSQPAAILDHL